MFSGCSASVLAQQIGDKQALAGRVEGKARRLGVAQAGQHIVDFQGFDVDHVQHAAVLTAVAGQEQALVGRVDRQLAQVARVALDVLAVLVLGFDLAFQLHDAQHAVGQRVDHGDRQIHCVAEVQAAAGIVVRHAEGLALQRYLALDGQGLRVQAQHLGRAGVGAKAAGRGHEQRVLARAVGQLIQALGQRLALHLGGGLGRHRWCGCGRARGGGGLLRAAGHCGGQSQRQQGRSRFEVVHVDPDE
ncbi:hypothetical protein [Ottowia oryzae]|uniref:hypothetical protein n=1 Tax=Ottowia oryzae TaxID=2109914 RepID=UPI001B804C44|nr:hypothetical protein [Ottowia oryzae]